MLGNQIFSYFYRKSNDMHFELTEEEFKQIEGLELCNQAMKLLNEKVEDGWN